MRKNSGNRGLTIAGPDTVNVWNKLSFLQRQATSVLSHWITKHIHVFHPPEQPLVVQACPTRLQTRKISMAKNI